MIAIPEFLWGSRDRSTSNIRDGLRSSVGKLALPEFAAVGVRERGYVPQHPRLATTPASYVQISCRFLAMLLVLLATGINPAIVQSENQPRQLTFDGRLKRDPVFVNQGREIVYAVQHEKPRLVLYRLRLSDGHTERLHPDSPLPEFRPVYSRDEATFAYLQMAGNDRLIVQVRRVGRPQPLVVKPTAAVIWHAALTPDGQHLLYAASGQLRMYPLSGGTERTLTQSAGRNNWPGVSPSGRQIVFGSSRLGNFDLFTLDLDQKTTRRLTTNTSMDVRPNWSPDGKQIAFVSTRHRNYEVYLIGRDGNGLTRVTHNPERDDYPAWHPDGQHLVSVSQRDGQTDLFLHSIPPH